MEILLAATLIGLATLTSATSAAAYVVAVPTSFPVDAIDDDRELDAAIDTLSDAPPKTTN